MKKSIWLLLFISIIGVSIYWFFPSPSVDDAAIIMNDNISSQIAVDSGKPQVKALLIEPTVVLSSQELGAVKIKANQMQDELSSLSVELNSNLDNTRERKIIEDKYKSLTEKYNKLVLQIVKAEVHSSASSE